jgi:hypothetical protein
MFHVTIVPVELQSVAISEVDAWRVHERYGVACGDVTVKQAGMLYRPIRVDSDTPPPSSDEVNDMCPICMGGAIKTNHATERLLVTEFMPAGEFFDRAWGSIAPHLKEKLAVDDEKAEIIRVTMLASMDAYFGAGGHPMHIKFGGKLVSIQLTNVLTGLMLVANQNLDEMVDQMSSWKDWVSSESIIDAAVKNRP